MQIETIPVGMLQANCYIVTKNNKAVIIDPGDELNKIQKQIKDKEVVGILVTHHHFDHVGALLKLEKIYHLKHNPKEIPGFPYETIFNPGHSKDSISFYFKKEKILFSGDFIFYHSIGRWDLEGGDWKEMQESLKNILNYPKDLKIYPGHGPATTLIEEIPYLKKLALS